MIRYSFPKKDAHKDLEFKAELDNLKNLLKPVKFFLNFNLLIFFLIFKENIEFVRKYNDLENESVLDQFVDENIFKELKSNFIYLPFIFKAVSSCLIEINTFLTKSLPKTSNYDTAFVKYLNLFFR